MNEINKNANYNNKTFEEIKHIDENGSTMPEDLPTPKKSLKQLEKEKKEQRKKS